MPASFDEGLRLAGESARPIWPPPPNLQKCCNATYPVKPGPAFLVDQKMQEVLAAATAVVKAHLCHKELSACSTGLTLEPKLVLIGDPMQHGIVGRGRRCAATQ